MFFCDTRAAAHENDGCLPLPSVNLVSLYNNGIDGVGDDMNITFGTSYYHIETLHSILYMSMHSKFSFSNLHHSRTYCTPKGDCSP